MRMSYYKLPAYFVTDVTDIKPALFFGYTRMEHHLKHKVSQFFTHKRRVAVVYCLNDLVCLFYKVLPYRLMGLLSVPRAAALGTKKAHDGAQILKCIVCFFISSSASFFIRTQHPLSYQIIGKSVAARKQSYFIFAYASHRKHRYYVYGHGDRHGGYQHQRAGRPAFAAEQSINEPVRSESAGGGKSGAERRLGKHTQHIKPQTLSF